ncbi:zinc ABC transporter substrate-binding protein ZnuA [Vibrio mangrovi]|uniref:High-affinity zinc uptake system protein ZnuA n=1 Tax=Vibrio mangrovi TaxID=474394 RepID=A0A1Y6ISA1_9VIBR|nr:zinc ABC transporter substrate-binding protein ZnuA [Vibrio mangrovi]MDW6001472.1 zinc ABC transporter substrate-binding protein [Vibrio mangrovi]SMS00506.1 High-affinity zinc uptake system protein ZnuA precursor [Vibrio mangrovi]
MKFFRLATFTLLFCMSVPVWALNVLTSVKPIQMISYELMAGVDEPDVLLAANTSPHDYALRPSDVKRIRQADLVIWFGEGLEPFLAKVLSQQSGRLTISQIKDAHFRHFSASHEDDGHHHGNTDPHFWLGIEQVREVAKAISARLIQLDPNHTTQYQTNLTRFLAQLTETDNQIQTQLAAYQQSPYYVFHDAYEYFESHYHLNNIGHFTVSPDRKPGAKTLIDIRTTLQKQPGVCIFSEPQFLPSVITSVTRGTSARIGVLDPLATDIPLAKGSYFHFLSSLSQSYISCFKSQK